jgi:hypothetical protein
MRAVARPTAVGGERGGWGEHALPDHWGHEQRWLAVDELCVEPDDDPFGDSLRRHDVDYERLGERGEDGVGLIGAGDDGESGIRRQILGAGAREAGECHEGDEAEFPTALHGRKIPVTDVKGGSWRRGTM